MDKPIKDNFYREKDMEWAFTKMQKDKLSSRVVGFKISLYNE